MHHLTSSKLLRGTDAAQPPHPAPLPLDTHTFTHAHTHTIVPTTSTTATHPHLPGCRPLSDRAPPVPAPCLPGEEVCGVSHGAGVEDAHRAVRPPNAAAASCKAGALRGFQAIRAAGETHSTADCAPYALYQRNPGEFLTCSVRRRRTALREGAANAPSCRLGPAAVGRAAHRSAMYRTPTWPCSEHGETLSKLEKKAALTLQMNFQVGRCAALCSAVLRCDRQEATALVHPETHAHTLNQDGGVSGLLCSDRLRGGKHAPAAVPALLAVLPGRRAGAPLRFLQYRRDEQEGRDGGRRGHGGAGPSGSGAGGSGTPSVPHPLAAVLGGERRAVVIGGAASVPAQLRGRGGSRGGLQEALHASVESAQVESAVRASQQQAQQAEQAQEDQVLNEADFPSVGGAAGSGGMAVGGRWAGAAGGGVGGAGLNVEDFPALPGVASRLRVTLQESGASPGLQSWPGACLALPRLAACAKHAVLCPSRPPCNTCACGSGQQARPNPCPSPFPSCRWPPPFIRHQQVCQATRGQEEEHGVGAGRRRRGAGAERRRRRGAPAAAAKRRPVPSIGPARQRAPPGWCQLSGCISSRGGASLRGQQQRRQQRGGIQASQRRRRLGAAAAGRLGVSAASRRAPQRLRWLPTAAALSAGDCAALAAAARAGGATRGAAPAARGAAAAARRRGGRRPAQPRRGPRH